MNKDYKFEDLERREKELFQDFLNQGIALASKPDEEKTKPASPKPTYTDEDDDEIITSIKELLPDMSELKNAASGNRWQKTKLIFSLITKKENTKKKISFNTHE